MRFTYSLDRQEYIAGISAIVKSVDATPAHRTWANRLHWLIFGYYGLFLALTFGLIWLYPEASSPLLFFGAVALLMQAAWRWSVDALTHSGFGNTYDPQRYDRVQAASPMRPSNQSARSKAFFTSLIGKCLTRGPGRHQDARRVLRTAIETIASSKEQFFTDPVRVR